MAAIDDDGTALPTNGVDRSHRQGYLTIGEELRRAAEIQRYLLPPPVYTGRFVEVAGATRPCRAVGGDFFDYHDVGHEFRVVLGDVCGKGAPAALQAALVQGILAFQAEADGGPAKLVAHLNRALCRRMIPNRFVTMFCAILTSENRLTYCNAGQCRPILLNGQCLRRLSTGGCPLGLFPNASYEEESLTINGGDTLVVFSDGMSEAAAVSGRRDEEFGDTRILEIVREVNGANGAAPAILNRLLAGLRTYTRHARQSDDVTALVVRYRAGRDPVDGPATGA